APDREVLEAAFPRESRFSNEALLVIYEEFFSRKLAVPDSIDMEIITPPHDRRLFLRLRALIVYLAVSAACAAVCAALGFFTLRGWSPWWVLFYLVAILPPGWAAIAYMYNRPLGFSPDLDGYTRCGRCGYILRGIEEPRCPECGTRI
ncbi:MAG: hypothetical protein GY778_19235, partial [bacterium]|nr:hypothetical protein [bacterium]